MKISVEVVPHDTQRYDTVGDWTFEPDGTLNINVSRITDVERVPVEVKEDYGGQTTHYKLIPDAEQEDSEFLVAIHEIIEAWLCKKAGITQQQVDEFDFHAAIARVDEPGDDPTAPYHVQHIVAQSVEIMLCAQLGLSWEEHSRKVNNVK